MERLTYRSTSMIDLQAELRERDLLAASRRVGVAARAEGPRPTVLGWLFRRPRHRPR